MNRILTYFLILFLIVSQGFSLMAQSLAYREYVDLPYRSENTVEIDSLQCLNLVLPSEQVLPPLLIWIGGGAWSYGDRNQEMDLARKFASRGIAVASVGHRLSPATWRDPKLDTGVRHPAHAEDIAAAIKWLMLHAGTYGYDPEGIFIGGYSSGAHLAALLGLNPAYLRQQGLSPTLFKGLLPISGTYDIEHYHTTLGNGSRPELAELHVEAVFGTSTDDFIEASPTTYLENLSAPILLMSDVNMTDYTHVLEEKIKDSDFNQFEVIYIPEMSHGELWRDLSFADKSNYRDKMVEFILKNTPRLTD